MFLNRLGASEKLAFMQLACHIANSDGEHGDLEARLLDQMSHEMHFAYEDDELEVDFEEAAAGIHDPLSRRIALLELLSLGYVDQTLHEQETILIRKLASYYGVSDAELERMDQWVQRMMELSLEGEKLLA